MEALCRCPFQSASTGMLLEDSCHPGGLLPQDYSGQHREGVAFGRRVHGEPGSCDACATQHARDNLVVHLALSASDSIKQQTLLSLRTPHDTLRTPHEWGLRLVTSLIFPVERQASLRRSVHAKSSILQCRKPSKHCCILNYSAENSTAGLLPGDDSTFRPHGWNNRRVHSVRPQGQRRADCVADELLQGSPAPRCCPLPGPHKRI